MKGAVTVKQTLDRLPEIKKALKKMAGNAVYIGVPAEKADRNGPINNAELSYIHEYGAPARNIPARPHLVPGVQRILPEAAKELADGARQALAGNDKALDASLEKIGLAGQNSVRQMFADNDWPPLSEKTLNYKPLLKDDKGNPVKDKNGNPSRKPSRLEQGKVNPLFVTGSLRNSHIYVIREKRGG